ncbi:MAG TPA: hypothetical protein VN887_17070 [Candidatus Angelobacter sp.]|nr:hypothetical protein [Candidatus Angelobacter sp.]
MKKLLLIVSDAQPESSSLLVAPLIATGKMYIRDLDVLFSTT